jgi:hypothetical protein
MRPCCFPPKRSLSCHFALEFATKHTLVQAAHRCHKGRGNSLPQGNDMPTNEETALQNWEYEGGALRAPPDLRTHNKTVFVCLACLVALPFFYWLVIRITI